MEELEQKINDKRVEIKDKFADVINEISAKHGVDTGVAFDMLLSTCRGGDYAEGFEFDRAELQKDYDELKEMSKEFATMKGLVVE